jgi:uncharacterized protein (DUF433 family)
LSKRVKNEQWAITTRISINQEILFGKPSIRNMRYPVSMILDLLSEGMTNEEILENLI